jgi:hypothetical protein
VDVLVHCQYPQVSVVGCSGGDGTVLPSTLTLQTLVYLAFHLLLFHLRFTVMKEGSNAGSRKTVGQKQERYLVSHNFVDEHRIVLRPQGDENVHKVIHIEIAFLSLLSRRREPLFEQRVANPLVGGRSV